jgi:hypothetical protein
MRYDFGGLGGGGASAATCGWVRMIEVRSLYETSTFQV